MLERQKVSLAKHCVCGPLPRYCMCKHLARERAKLFALRHAVQVFIHPRELSRSNSTHRLLLALFDDQTCGLEVVGGVHGGSVEGVVKEKEEGEDKEGEDKEGGGSTPPPPGVTFTSTKEAWGRVLASCQRTGRTPAVLFPSPHSQPIPTWLASLTPQQRSKGAHVVALEATWSETSSMARELHALGAPFVSLSSLGGPSLFQPCRKQVAATKVCTAEAVALFLGECGHPYHSKVLLDCLRTLVDRITRQTGLICPTARGSGHRTWELGEGGGEHLGRIPAWCVERIAEYAYGVGSVCPSFYRERRAGGGSVACSWEVGREGSALPPPSQYTQTPLAHASKSLYFFAAGHWNMRRPSKKHTQAQEEGGKEV